MGILQNGFIQDVPFQIHKFLCVLLILKLYSRPLKHLSKQSSEYIESVNVVIKQWKENLQNKANLRDLKAATSL